MCIRDRKGCKSWKAKQIADSVFELLNEILNRTHERQQSKSKGSFDNSDSVRNGAASRTDRKASKTSLVLTPHKSSAESTSA